jgi:delta24-sterol reductase
MVPPKVSLLKLTQTAAVKKLYEEKHMIQDMLVPVSSLEAALKLFHDSVQVMIKPNIHANHLTHILLCLQVYPIWLCPFKLPKNPGMLNNETGTNEIFVDIGLYGVPKVLSYHAQKTTRKLEAFVRDCKG